MLTLTDLSERLDKKNKELKAASDLVLEQPQITAEDRQRVDDLAAEVDKLQADYEWALKLDNRMKAREQFLDEPRDTSVPVAPQLSNSAVARDPELDAAGGFRDIRDFMLAVTKSEKRMDNRLIPLIVDSNATLMNTAGSDEQMTVSDPYGGFLIPHILLPRLLKVDPEVDPTVNLVQNIPMAGPMVSIPARVDKTHYVATDAAATPQSYVGGIRVLFKSETQDASSSRIQFERVELHAHTAMGLVYATEEILQDSPQSMTAIINDGFRTQWNAKMFEYKLVGTGANQPEGILNAPSLVQVTRTASGQIVGQDVINIRERVWGYQNAIWLASYSAMAQLMETEIAFSSIPLFRPGSRTPGWGDNTSDDKPDMLLGRPIFFTEQCKTLGTAGDLICANWREYLWGSRQGEQMAESIHVRFAANERAFRFTWRGDGRTWWRSPLQLRNDTTTPSSPFSTGYTLSPYVTLTTA